MHQKKMIGKKFEKNTVSIAIVLYAKKNILLMFRNITYTMKKSYSFNDFKRIKMTLSYSQKSISIAERNYIKK